MKKIRKRTALKGSCGIFYKNEYLCTDEFKYDWDFNGILNGNRGIITINSESQELEKLFFEDKYYPFYIEGKTKQGDEFSGEKLFLNKLQIGKPRSEFKFIPTTIILGSTDNYEKYDKYEYYLPNTIVSYDHKASNSEKTQFYVKYKSKTYRISIFKMNYSRSNEKLIKKRKDEITTKLIIESCDGKETIKTLDRISNTIFDLFSFAYGDMIKWVYAYAYKNNKIIFMIIKDSDKFCSLKPKRPLTKTNLPRSLSSMIKACFNKHVWLSNRKRIAFASLIHNIQLCSNYLIFPIPFILLGASIENLANILLKEEKTEYISKNIRNDILLEPFTKWVNSKIHPQLEKNDKKAFDNKNMKSKLAMILQRTLMTRINNLLDEYQIKRDQEKIKMFKKKRDLAAHGDYEYSKDDYPIWSYMASLLEQLFLTKMNYNGKYVNWAKIPPEYEEFGSNNN